MVKIIAIKVGVSSDKSRRKALKLAAAAPGVESVGLNGEDGVIVVTGDEVDAVCLTNSMRKKFSYVELLSLQDVNPSGDDADDVGEEGGGEDGGGDDTEEELPPPPSAGCPCNCNCSPHHQFAPPPPCPTITCYALYDPYPTTMCSLM